MDQTKFINAYINNLAEQLKSSTLDIIMVKTQLAMANDTVTELTAKVEELEATLKANQSASTETPKKTSKQSEFTND